MSNKKGYTSPGYKTLQCCKCGDEVKRVAVEATAVTCWRCSMKQIKKYETVIREGDTN